MQLRSMLERSTHRLVVRRRLPRPFAAARICASTEGGLRYLRPNMAKVDPVLIGLVRELVHPGDVVWDIGANLGLFTFAAAVAAGPAGRVLAVEPDPLLVTMLNRAAGLNTSHAHVDVLAAAVSDAVGIGRFHIARRNRSTSHLDGFGTTQTGGTRMVHVVTTVTLDWLADRLPPPTVVKIDVEAAEVQALTAAASVLRRRPQIICETAAENAAAVREILAPYDYTFYDADQPANKRHPQQFPPPNTLAVPVPRPSKQPAPQHPGVVTAVSRPAGR
jgi:FkbM family methyltransferase